MTTSSDLAGVEGIIARILRRPGRYRHALLTLEGAGELVQVARDAGWPAVQVGAGGRFSLARLPAAVRALRALVPDIVQAYLPASNLVASYFGRHCGARAIVTGQHFGPDEFARRPFKAWLATHAVRRSDAVVSVSHAARRWLVEQRGVPPDRVVVIPNAVDLEALRLPDREATRRRLRAAWEVPPSAVLFVMLARFQPPKDHAGAVDALAQLPPGTPEVCLAFCGPEVGRGAVEAYARERGVQSRLRFPGLVSPAEGYAAGDAALLVSRSEGLPTALLEAMALGLPCLATDCGGVSEAVPDGVCGLLVPPGDTTALAAAMGRLARDAALRDALGQAGRQRVEQRFSLPGMIAAYEALWDRLLGIDTPA